MVDTSNVVILAIVFCFIALFVVIILLIRTTRKVVDNTNVLLKRDADAVLAASPVDKLKHDLSCMNQPAKMNDSQLMDWMDAKMDEMSLYQNPDLDNKLKQETIVAGPDETCLSIPNGMTITLDLGGRTLNRNRSAAEDQKSLHQ